MLYLIAVIGGLVLAIYGFIAYLLLRAAREGRREQAEENRCLGVRQALAAAAARWEE